MSVVALLLTGCTGGGTSGKRVPQAGDTLYCADFLNSGIARWISDKSLSTDDIQQRLCQYSADHSTSTHEYTVAPDDRPST